MYVNYSATQANDFHQCWDIDTEPVSQEFGLVASICLELAVNMFGNLNYFASVSASIENRYGFYDRGTISRMCKDLCLCHEPRVALKSTLSKIPWVSDPFPAVRVIESSIR